eukprot:TRINITY_DN42239_c0_g2_i2.p1 TRINITY_DN42239_c0_g2~~TRINITY_DN42239_c0_g2_i2.p1  ORF type:complete len:112 (+),score=20.07 TRINITY_DN42239_c0_g2_i2:108-443(+)
MVRDRAIESASTTATAVSSGGGPTVIALFAAFTISFVGSIAASSAVAFQLQRCGASRRLLHELLGACRDDGPEALAAAHYRRLKEPGVASDDRRVRQLLAARKILGGPSSV